jgi:hypothetical protein
MNKTTKKLFMSSLALAFAAATTISTTYAWFTMQTTARVDTIDLNVTTGTGFEIKFGGATNDSNFKQTLTASDFNKAYPNRLTNLSLQHVTSNTGVNGFEKLIVDTKTFTPATTNVDYLEFEIDFRGRAPYSIYLKPVAEGGSYIWSEGKAFISNSSVLEGTERFGPDDTVTSLSEYLANLDSYPAGADPREKGTTVGEGDTIVAFAADAARLSIQDTRIGGSSKKVLDFSEDSIGGYGDESATNNLALDYYNSILADKLSYPTENNKKPATAVAPSTITSKSKGNELVVLQPNLVEGKGYYYGQIKIRVWLEGWDADCFNAIFNDQLHIGLAFDGQIDNVAPEFTDYEIVSEAIPGSTIGYRTTLSSSATDNLTIDERVSLGYEVKRIVDTTSFPVALDENHSFVPTVAGNYEATFTATDPSGNVKTETIAFTVGIDEIGPTIDHTPITSVKKGELISLDAIISDEHTKTADLGIEYILEYSEDGVVEFANVEPTDDKYTISEVGFYKVTIKATDKVGNETTETYTFEVTE